MIILKYIEAKKTKFYEKMGFGVKGSKSIEEECCS